MVNHSLYDIITSRVQSRVGHLFVVPLIRFNYPNTDYLYLLYKPLIDTHPEIQIHSTSAIAHFRFVWAQIFGQKPILHYHWLEFQDMKSALGMPYKLLCVALFKLLGGKLIWTIHNLAPHNKKWLSSNKSIQKWMSKKADILLVHSETSQRLAADYLEIEPDNFVIHPHPVYPTIEIEREKALTSLEEILNVELHSTGPVFLMAGAISSYKGFPEVIELLKSINQDWTLIITGYLKKGQEHLHKLLLENGSSNPKIIYHPEFIQEEDYPLYYSVADVCIFNFDEILTSGGVEMALAYNKTVFAPAIGSLPDYESNPNMHLFSNQNELKTLLVDLISGHSYG